MGAEGTHKLVPNKDGRMSRCFRSIGGRCQTDHSAIGGLAMNTRVICELLNRLPGCRWLLVAAILFTVSCRPQTGTDASRIPSSRTMVVDQQENGADTTRFRQADDVASSITSSGTNSEDDLSRVADERKSPAKQRPSQPDASAPAADVPRPTTSNGPRFSLALGATVDDDTGKQRHACPQRVSTADTSVSLLTDQVWGFSLTSQLADSVSERSLQNRIMVVSNTRHEEVCFAADPDIGRLEFCLANNTHEPLTLESLRVDLVGIIVIYEDQIAEPIAPKLVAPIEDLTVPANSPPKCDYVNLKDVFDDDDNPDSELTFAVEAGGDLVKPRLEDNGALELSFKPGYAGTSQIRVTATDPFDLTSVDRFLVKVTHPSAKDGPNRPSLTRKFPQLVSVPRYEAVVPPEKPKIRLGTVLFRHMLVARESVTPTSIDLLSAGETFPLLPRSAQRFSVNIAVQTTVNMPTSPPFPDMLFGRQRRRLAVFQPKVARSYHVLVAKARIVPADSEPYELYCDQVFTCVSQSAEADTALASGQHAGPVRLELQDCEGQALRKFLQSIIGKTLSLHSEQDKRFSFELPRVETMAYKRARRCLAVPQDFDRLDVSPLLYYGDAESPFRLEGLPGHEAFPAVGPFSAKDRWLRSNTVEVLLSFRRRHAAIWPVVAGEMKELCATTGDEELRRKAEYTRQAVAPQADVPIGSESFVGVSRISQTLFGK